MDNHDYIKMRRKALFELFDQERREWLDAGMSEADIFKIHFGEDGNGGDYAVWLAERKHIRADHKNAPGTPLSIESADPDGIWIPDTRNEIAAAEAQADLERALDSLTELQRYCVEKICLNGHSYSEVARERGKHHSTIQEAIKAAKAKIKKII